MTDIERARAKRDGAATECEDCGTPLAGGEIGLYKQCRRCFGLRFGRWLAEFLRPGAAAKPGGDGL